MAETSGSNHTTRALTEIRKRILSGELAGGERLFEVPLAEMLSISRTPVREAMSRLAEEGLLERAKSAGFVVRAFGVEDVIDAIELRGVLEGTAARLAAERGGDPLQLEQMTEIVGRLDACFQDGSVDFEIYSKGNEEFHSVLARLAGSKIIEWELDRVVHLPFASPSAFLPDKVNVESRHTSLVIAQAQHREILSAIRTREGARAEALAREHARTARRDLEEAMKKKGDANLLPGLALMVT
ncbi:GntR family transcriptional regulator [Roseibium marinum]|uniref:GntR family transcriptional regulator of vanillate catabolism n=1 Tax=Roseibium marinum TaxID=281252 RepID=A0A2S3UT35_9HYPH|nr:GntR family transcriptional regulator [Roseibium marinum]POF30888.1 GntR family transcriptional regulator of vanillate catabolism [Roseibium marinum]